MSRTAEFLEAFLNIASDVRLMTMCITVSQAIAIAVAIR